MLGADSYSARLENDARVLERLMDEDVASQRASFNSGVHHCVFHIVLDIVAGENMPNHI
jgi:hypothetical protein